MVFDVFFFLFPHSGTAQPNSETRSSPFHLSFKEIGALENTTAERIEFSFGVPSSNINCISSRAFRLLHDSAKEGSIKTPGKRIFECQSFDKPTYSVFLLLLLLLLSVGIIPRRVGNKAVLVCWRQVRCRISSNPSQSV